MSLSEIIRARCEPTFVGRATEVRDFRENLRGPVEQRRFVVNIAGQAGVGKTTLLRAYDRMAHEEGWVTASVDETSPDLVSAMSSIVAQLSDGSGVRLKKARRRFDDFAAFSSQMAADPDAAEWVEKLGTIVGRVTHAGVQQLPVVGAVSTVIGHDVSGQVATAFVDYVHRTWRKDDDRRMMLDPVAYFGPRFTEALRQVAARRPMLVSFDTYERTSEYLVPWLRSLVDANYGADYGALPADMVFAVSGQKPLEWWDDLERVIHRVELSAFSDAEVAELARARGIDDPNVVAKLSQLTGGHPLLLDMYCSVPPDELDADASGTKTVVDRFLKWIELPVRRDLVLRCAVPRSLSFDTIAQVAGSELTIPDREWFLQQPFVTARSNDWAYNAMVRAHLLRHLRNSSPHAFSELHERLARWFESLADAGAHVVDDSAAEALYHRLCGVGAQPVGDAIDALLRRGLGSERSAAIVDVVRAAGEDADNAVLEDLADELEALRSAFEAHDRDALDAGLTSLLQREAVVGAIRARVLAWRASVHGDEPMRALADLDECRLLAPDDPEFAADRAGIRIQIGELAGAVDDLGVVVDRATDQTAQAALLARGSLRIALQDWAAAEGDLTSLLDREPNNVSALVSRSIVRYGLGETAASIVDLDRALVLEPDNIGLRAQRATLLADDGDSAAFEEVIDELDESAERLVDTLADQFANVSDGHVDQMIEAVAHGLQQVGTWSLRRLYDAVRVDRELAVGMVRSDFAALKARLLMKHGDMEGAARSLERALELDPDNAVARVALAAVLMVQGRADDLAELERHMESSADAPAIAGALGRLRWIQDDREEGLRHLDHALESDPTCPTYRVWRAEARIASGDHAGAAEDLEVAVAVNPTNWDVLWKLASLYGALDRRDDQAAIFDRLADDAVRALPTLILGMQQRGLLSPLESDDSHAPLVEPAMAARSYRLLAAMLRAGAHWDSGQHQTALRALAAVVRLSPEQSKPWATALAWLKEEPDLVQLTDRGEDDVVRAMWCASRELAVGDAERAVELFDEVLAVGELASAYTLRAAARQEVGDAPAAIADLGRAIELAPTDPVPYMLRAGALESTDHLADAVADWDVVLDGLAAGGAQEHFARGEVRRKLGTPEHLRGAIRDFNIAGRLGLTPAVALGSRGQARLALGELDAARDDLEYAIRLDPALLWAWASRIELITELPEAEQAADAQHLVDFVPVEEPIAPVVHLLLARDQREAAIGVARRLADAAPHDHDRMVLLASVLEFVGVDDEALAVASKIVQTAPDNEDAWQVIGRTSRNLGREHELIERLREEPDVLGASAALQYLLGGVAIRAGHYVDAEQAFARSADLNPESDFARYEQSRAVRHQGRGDDADELVVRALERLAVPDPPHTYRLPALCNRSLYLLALDRGDEALASYAEMLAEVDDRETVQTAVTELDELVTSGVRSPATDQAHELLSAWLDERQDVSPEGLARVT